MEMENELWTGTGPYGTMRLTNAATCSMFPFPFFHLLLCDCSHFSCATACGSFVAKGSRGASKWV